MSQNESYIGIFLFNDVYVNILTSILTQLEEPSKVILFDRAIRIPSNISSKVEVIYFETYFNESEIEEFNKNAIKFLQEISTEIHNLKQARFLETEGNSLWWISGHSNLYRDVANSVSWIEIFVKIFKSVNFHKIILPAVSDIPSLFTKFYSKDHNYPYKILEAVSVKFQVQVEHLPVSLSRKFSQYLTYLIQYVFHYRLGNWYLLGISIYRKLISRFTNPRFSVERTGRKTVYILSPPTNWGKVYDLKTSQKISGDSKLGIFYQKLHRDNLYNLIGIDTSAPDDPEAEVLKMKIAQDGDEYLHWKSIEYDSRIWDIISGLLFRRRFRQQVHQFLKNPALAGVLSYKGVSLEKILQKRLFFVFETLLLHGLFLFQQYARLFSKPESAAVVITNENAPHGRAAILASWVNNIPTLAIQHGKIHAAHPQYIHEGTSTRENSQPSFPPIADRTCVFGQGTYDVLSKVSGYPEKNLLITGSLASDPAYWAERLYDKNQFLNSINCDSDKPTICMMTQSFDTPDQYQKFFRTVCEGLNGIKDINFLVKVHPSEDTTYTETLISQYYREDSRVRMLQTEDLYEIIYASDLVIIGNSTVGMETMIFKKPLVSVEGFKYSMGYAESGASLGVTTPNELEQAVRLLLTEPKARKKVITNGEKYLRYHLYKIDGKCSERIESALIKLIKTFQESQLKEKMSYGKKN